LSAFGEFRPAALSAAAQELRLDVRAFLADELDAGRFVPAVDSWLSGWDEPFSRRLGERGLLGLALPVEYGGQGRTSLDRFVVIEELLAAGAPVAAHWIADRQAGPSLLHHGSEEQRHRFLPSVSRGEGYFALGMSEPDTGSDLASVRTFATREDGGWRLSGTKIWTSGANHAEWMITLARTESRTANRHAGLSQFLLPLRAEGVLVRPIALLTGEPHFNEVVLHDVFVPDDLVLGQVGSGWRQVTAELAYERSGPERILSTFLLLSSLVGALPQTERNRVMVGTLVARLFVLREMSLRVAATITAGDALATQAALVKDLGTTFEQDVVEAARQLLAVEPDPRAAPDSFAYRLARAVLHSPGFTLRGGATEILRGMVAKQLTSR
jgi:alkylation response protein AidB-like acyl-CoA dehydrogenase